MHSSPDDADTESAIVYLVENKHGQRTFVKRPPAPLTSSPLDDDFDRATTLPSTSPRFKQKHGNSRYPWSGNELADSASPLDDDFDAVTYTIAGGGRDLAGSTLDGRDRASPPRRSESRNESRRVLPTYQPVSISPRKENVIFGRRQGEARAAPDFVLSPLRRPPQELERVELVERGGQSKISKPSKLGSSTPRPSEEIVQGTRDAISPRTGQSFEIVNRRIVEDGPERTVLISTWREQVADATTHTAEGMDVYYLNAADYAAETAIDRTAVEDADSPRARKVIIPPTHIHQESEERSNQGSIRSIPDEGEISPARPRKASGPTFPPPVEEVYPATKRSGSAQSWNRDNSPRKDVTEADRHRPIHTPGGPRRGPNGYHVPGAQASSPPPRSSTPLQQHSPADRMIHIHGSMTPHRDRGAYIPQMSAPMTSFHPTQSGATISTIKSAGTVAFEKVLASCDPPLLHIAPALANLGIVNDGHLRAISRLSEETRDKEVREEALRQGITVMEWAILLDRLQQL